MGEILEEKITNTIIFLLLDARRANRRRYLSKEGTMLLIKEVVEEELKFNKLELANKESFEEDIKNAVYKILDDIAISETDRNIWHKKYYKWLEVSKTDC